MQRLHESDVSGEILSSESGDDWVHLMIPAQYEWRRHCRTVLGWQDPRGLDDNGAPLVAFDQDGVRYPRDANAEIELERRGHRRIMLIKAWRKHLPFSGPRIERGERERWMAYKRRTQDSWGLLEWLYHSISNHAFPPSHPRHWMCHKLLIEAKASGISAAQELRNRFRFAQSAIELVKGR
jgi:hypothetical protein